MAQSPQSTAGAGSLDKVIWWVVAVIGAAGVVYAGVMAYLVLGTVDWDVLFGRLDSHPAGVSSNPAPPPPLAPEMPAGPAGPGAPAAPGAPAGPGAAVPPGPSAVPPAPAAPPAAPRPR